MRWSWLPLAGLLAVAVLAIRRALFVVRIDGVSMEPTYRPGDAVLAVRTPLGPPVRRGDVVVCRLPAEVLGPTGYLVKRVAGLDGDAMNGGGLVPPGRVFVLGDGTNSYDSRRFGPLPLSAVRGRVIARLSLPVRPASDRR
jgi:signal peptidase I